MYFGHILAFYIYLSEKNRRFASISSTILAKFSWYRRCRYKLRLEVSKKNRKNWKKTIKKQEKKTGKKGKKRDYSLLNLLEARVVLPLVLPLLIAYFFYLDQYYLRRKSTIKMTRYSSVLFHALWYLVSSKTKGLSHLRFTPPTSR